MVEMDAPFIEVDVTRNGERRYGSVAVCYRERVVDLATAKSSEVAKASANHRALSKASLAAQYREVNRYDAIYFVGPEEGFPLKIGFSGAPVHRLGGIQTGNWQQLGIHGALWSPDAIEIEQEAHRLASEQGLKARGEWVWATLETAVDIVLDATRNVKGRIMTPAIALYNQGIAMLAHDQAQAAQDAQRGANIQHYRTLDQHLQKI